MGSLQGKEILIIDDAPDMRLLAQKVLEGDGAAVSVAESVDQGMALIQAKAPHLIITDLNMPEKSGFDLLAIRQKTPALLAIPMIVLSGLNDRNSVMEAAARGATDYVLKPIRAPLLLQKARKALNAATFLSYRFTELPLTMVSLAAEILDVSEAGARIECPVKLGPNEEVKITSDFLTELGCANVHTRTTLLSSEFRSRGRYGSELNFVGIGEVEARMIRNRIK